MRVPAIAAVLAAGCTTSSISTRRVATFGYRDTQRIALLARGSADVVEVWRDGLRATPTVALVAEPAQPTEPTPPTEPVPLAPPAADDECHPPGLATPVDHVVVLELDQTAK